MVMRYNFILYGQSNASGRGTGAPPEYAHNDRIFCYRNDSTWAVAAEPIDDDTGQTHTGSIDTNAGNGFGMAFANRLCELHEDVEIGLIPCAKGSTYITSLRPHPQSGVLYGNLCKRAWEASAEGLLSGILWWQGEAEASSENDALAQAWPDGFGTLVARSRVDLGVFDLPWACVRLNNLNAAKPNWTNLRTRQGDMFIRNVAIVSSDGVEYQADHVHCTTAGYVDMGIRIADALDPLIAW